MILCLVLASDESGGLENHVLTLANNPLINEKYQVHLIAPDRFRNDVTTASFHALDATKSRKNPILLYKLVNLLRSIQPDVIHAHANKAASLISTIYPWLGFSCSKIATIHSEKRNTKGFSSFDTVIGVSHRVLNSVTNNNKVVIYNGVDVDMRRIRSRDFLQQTEQLSNKKILVMGRLVEVKRFDLLISIAGRLHDCDVLIVGEGKLRGQLESEVKKKKLNNVFFLGHRDDNIELMSASDLFVICSDREGFPYTLVESLRLHIPVVSTDVSDASLILPAENVVPVGDMEALYASIRKQIDDPEANKEKLENAFRWAQENTSLNNMIDQILKQYDFSLMSG
ncbi:glycosyltransferase family 4 protein [Leucothrix pacifica]|uniref:Glycosyltransferase n=1 Tax=Leucothrix pacifica TaxID=1247513 RepID=A0A317CPR3_9GAMM|nr:glycosyltransferase family 4 protein [Leucothrix pacifica]PWR00218.1 hypothetical protein DKW60_03505 [Leucothrix pacifica]